MPEKFSEVEWDEGTAFRVLADQGFFPYSGADGDLFRKHGVAGWRVSVGGRYLVRIQKKGPKIHGRNTWNTKREFHTEPQAADRYLQALGELPPEAIEDFEEELTTLVENGELSDEYEEYVYEPAGSGAFELEPIMRDAVDEFTEAHPPNDPVEINAGYCRVFVGFLQEHYDLPDGVEVIDAGTVHRWIRYEGRHYDAEHPAGVPTANDIDLWTRLRDEDLSVAIEHCQYLSEDELPPKAIKDFEEVEVEEVEVDLTPLNNGDLSDKYE